MCFQIRIFYNHTYDRTTYNKRCQLIKIKQNSEKLKCNNYMIVMVCKYYKT